MDLRRLRTFVVVAEQGTVSSAAKTLRITSPPSPAGYRICKLSLVFGFSIVWDGACG